MGPQHTRVSLAVLLLCGGILVLFTDLEISAVRWFNCGPWATPSERQTQQCR
jgi:hypothetical protein